MRVPKHTSSAAKVMVALLTVAAVPILIAFSGNAGSVAEANSPEGPVTALYVLVLVSSVVPPVLQTGTVPNIRQKIPTQPAANGLSLDDLKCRLRALSRPLEYHEIRPLLESVRLTDEELTGLFKPDETSYARNPFFRTAQCELVAITWLPGQESRIHGHDGSACGVRVLTGEATEVCYTAVGDCDAAPAGPGIVRPTGSVFGGGGADDIHTVGNRGREVLKTLHLYSTPLEGMRIYRECGGSTPLPKTRSAVSPKPVSKSKVIYLDNHASTRCDPRVRDAMLPYLGELSEGNPSSVYHEAGRAARDAREKGRAQVARLVGVHPDMVTFTASATEANNLAVVGAALAGLARGRGKHIIVSAVEHPSVRRPVEYLERAHGFEVSVAPVDGKGRVRVAELLSLVRDDTVLVSVMTANNEVGTLQPTAEITQNLPMHVLFHTDAAQSAGRLPINVKEGRIDLLTLAGHKMHGPKGIGALCRAGHVELAPQVLGNHQERGIRAGTENIPCIVGFGEACELYAAEWRDELKAVTGRRDELERLIKGQLDDVIVNGDADHRLPGNLHLSFLGVPSDRLMKAVPEVCVSSGAACTSGRGQPSQVLETMGLSSDWAESSIRFGLSRFTTDGEIEMAAGLVVGAVKTLRESKSLTRSA